MSDIDEYNSDSDSESSTSSIEKINVKIKKKVLDKDQDQDHDPSIEEDEVEVEEEEMEDDDDMDVDVLDEDEEEEEDEDEDAEVEVDEDYMDGGAKKEKVIKDKDNKKEKKTIVPKQTSLYLSDDEDDENDDNYLQKMDTELNKNYIVNFHPECNIHNYDEISIFTHIVRDDNNNIIDELHKTIPFLTKYEKARVLGQRAKQINCGSKPFIKVPENVIDGYIIAELELQQKRIPFIIRRPIPGGAFEYWNLKDLEIIAF